MTWPRTGTVVIVGSLLLFLIAAVGLAYEGSTIGGGFRMPLVGYVALGLGVVFSLLIGIGLMALVFYSSRAGYDEPARTEIGEREP